MRARARLAEWAPWLAFTLGGALIIAAVRSPAEATRASTKETGETYPLPPRDELLFLSMGYRAAAADLAWAHVLVTQGLRLGERRRFETVTRYLDAVMTLDPSFREPYRLADTLTTMQTVSATAEDVRVVRRLLERGVEQFPNDAELWLNLGQFVTWIAPASYLDAVDPEEAQRWRREGAAYLARAAELGSEDATIAWRAIGGVRQLHKAGELAATARFIERALAVTEDAELREHLGKQLAALQGDQAARKQRVRRQRFEEVWRGTYPTVPLSAVHAAGPPFDPAACAGGAVAPDAEEVLCATTWAAWNARVDADLDEQSRRELAMAPPAAPLEPPP